MNSGIVPVGNTEAFLGAWILMVLPPACLFPSPTGCATNGITECRVMRRLFARFDLYALSSILCW